MRNPAPTYGLTRQSLGLSPAQVALIKLLAQKAVNDYLAETDAATADEADQQEVSR